MADAPRTTPIDLDQVADEHQLRILDRDAGPAIRAGLFRLVDLDRSTRPGRPRYRIVVSGANAEASQ